MKNRVRRMVEDDESLKYAEYTDHSITKVGIPPPVLSQHQSKVADKTDQRKSLQNALKHFMSWEPVKFNFNYIIQKDEVYKSEELPPVVEAVSSAPIIFTTEEVIEETPEEIPAEIEMIEEDQSEELIEVLPSEEIHEDKIKEDIPEDIHTPEMVSETEDIEDESEESSEDEPEEPEETGPNAKEKTAMELSSFLSSLRSTYKTSSW